MKIIYVHGLDSSAQSVKGQLLEQYCEQYYPSIEIIRTDINLPPDKAFKKLCDYFLNDAEKNTGEQKMIMGSSLGGYFSTLVSNEVGCPAVLLNPSTEPHHSLQRFIDDRTYALSKS